MSHPSTQGTDRPNLFSYRLTSTVAWCVLVLAAPLLVLQATRLGPTARAEDAAKPLPADKPATEKPKTGVEHTFKLDMKQATDKPSTVHVAGEFNGWNAQGLAMSDDGTGMWSAKLHLDEGQYQYKFVLDAGTPKQKWIQDPAADPDLAIDDGHAGKNSVIIVGPGAAKFPPPQPNQINQAAIAFNPNDPADLDRIDENHVRIRVRFQDGDVEQVQVAPDNQQPLVPLYKTSVQRGLASYGGIVVLNRDPKLEPARRLMIVATDGDAKTIIGKNGVSDGSPDSLFDVPSVRFTTPAWAANAVWYQIFPERFRNGDPNNDPGDKWYENLVPWTSDWFGVLPGEAPGTENFFKGVGNVWDRRYGGDIAGVREKLPYLRSLGVTAIYFNPVFEAESMHKYDAADYRHIDDNLGVRDDPGRPPVGTGSDKPREAYKPIGNHKFFNLDGSPMPEGYVETEDPATWRWTQSDLLFLEFLKDARAQGFHVIIDGVFNHVGRAHPFFQDVLAKGKNSKFADWFEITDWGNEENWKPMEDPYTVHGKPGGIQWKAWDNPNGHLPVFKKDAARGLAAGPYDHIMAVTQRWGDPDGNPQTRDGIDGWRLDVPGDIPHPFWKEWRKVVKNANASGDAYIVGEIWGWANPWVNDGDEFDATMNYQFAMPCQEFFANQAKSLTPGKFNDRLVRLCYNYPFQSALVMQNLFDSHDTDRAASWFVNPDRPYDGQNRPQDNAAELGYDARRPTDTEWNRFLQMVAFQMSFVGAPMIYYGNEAGMYGPDDPSNRMPMWWDDLGTFENPDFRFDQRVFAFHQRAIAIRNRFEALRTGFYRPVLIDDARGVLVFARDRENESVTVVLNRSDKKVTVEVPVAAGVQMFDYLSSAAKVSFSDAGGASRPSVSIDPAATALPNADGKVTVELEPYGTAILAPR